MAENQLIFYLTCRFPLIMASHAIRELRARVVTGGGARTL